MFPEFTVQFRVIKIIIPAVTSQLLSIEMQCNFVLDDIVSLLFEHSVIASTCSALLEAQVYLQTGLTVVCRVWEQLPLPDRDLKTLFFVLCFVFLPLKAAAVTAAPSQLSVSVTAGQTKVCSPLQPSSPAASSARGPPAEPEASSSSAPTFLSSSSVIPLFCCSYLPRSGRFLACFSSLLIFKENV